MSFKGYDTQICLVSEQTLPNYLGACLSEPMPRTVHLVVTECMKEKADILEQALKRKGCKVEQHSIPTAGHNEVFNCLCDIEGSIEGPVAINVTGGTKVMALIAVEWANMSKLNPFIFYVDTQQRQILHLDKYIKNYPLSCNLSIADILFAGSGHGIAKKNKASTSKEMHASLKKLIELFCKDQSALKLFNKKATDAKGSYNLCVSWPTHKSSTFEAAMCLAKDLGKVTYNIPVNITYASEESRQWCNGGWLEEYVTCILDNMLGKKIIDDYGANIELDYRTHVKGAQKDAVQNEIDAAFSKNSILYLIECKTSDLTGADTATSNTRTKASDAIYKLDSLKKSLGGAFGRGMVVSVFEPREEDKKRAEELRLRLVFGVRLLGLEKELSQWIAN